MRIVVEGRLNDHQSEVIYGDDGISPTLERCDYKNPVKIMVENVDWPSMKGNQKAKEGDGIVTSRPYAARSTVMDQCSFAVTASSPNGVCVGNIRIVGELQDSKVEQDKRVYGEDGVSPTVVGAGGTGSKIKIEDGFVFRTERNEFGKQIRKQYENGLDVKWKDMKDMVPRTDGITNTLTGVVKDNVLGVYMDGNENEQGLGQNLRIRYLTPRECLRLQAFPDDAIDKLESVLSKSALYKVAGNSIAVCCLKAIFKGIYVDRTFKKDRQSSLDSFF